jgi:hypothetical protein
MHAFLCVHLYKLCQTIVQCIETMINKQATYNAIWYTNWDQNITCKFQAQKLIMPYIYRAKIIKYYTTIFCYNTCLLCVYISLRTFIKQRYFHLMFSHYSFCKYSYISYHYIFKFRSLGSFHHTLPSSTFWSNGVHNHKFVVKPPNSVVKSNKFRRYRQQIKFTTVHRQWKAVWTSARPRFSAKRTQGTCVVSESQISKYTRDKDKR